MDTRVLYCDRVIGNPWPNEKLKTFEGYWQETEKSDENDYQTVTYRLFVDSERNGLNYQEIDDPKMPRPMNKSAPLIRLTSLDSVDLVFLTGPDDCEYIILIGILERPAKDTLSLRLAVPESFRQQIKQGNIDGEILSPYLDDPESHISAISKTTIKATDEQLEKLIREDSDQSIFGPPMAYFKRTRR